MRTHTVTDALMPRTAQRQNESDLRRAAEGRPPVAGFVSGNQQQKDAERAELARLLAAFKRRGGKVEVLGPTPLRQAKSRRQATVDEAANRIAQASPPKPQHLPGAMPAPTALPGKGRRSYRLLPSP